MRLTRKTETPAPAATATTTRPAPPAAPATAAAKGPGRDDDAVETRALPRSEADKSFIQRHIYDEGSLSPLLDGPLSPVFATLAFPVLLGAVVVSAVRDRNHPS